MNWITELFIAGSGLISVFVVLLVLYLSILAISALAGKEESAKSVPPANERGKP